MYSNLVFTIGVLLLALAATPMIGRESQRDINMAEARAKSFLVYRAAVREYILEHPGYTGTINESDLDLPDMYADCGNWNGEANAGTVWIYGDMTPGGLRYAVDCLEEPINLGRKKAGAIISPVHGNTGIAVPGFVGEGQIVAVITNT